MRCPLFKLLSTLFLRAGLLFVLLLSMASAGSAIDDRVLVLPPSVQSDPAAGDSRTLWYKLLDYYLVAMIDAAPVPAEDLIHAWTGDTLRFDFYDIDSAREWGETLQADAVILSEWHGSGETGTVSLQRLNLWSGEVTGPVEEPSIALALLKLSPDRFLCNTLLSEPRMMTNAEGVASDVYQNPAFRDGDGAVHKYAHKHDVYPPDPLIQGISAVADVAVTVSHTGVPLEVKINYIQPPDMGFEEAFEKALWAVSYIPARWEEAAVNAVFRTKVRMYPIP